MDKNLIYDIGMHNGEDTAYYLFRGYRVVAIEANPLLVEQAQTRFKQEINDGSLTILNIGIAESNHHLDFWVNEFQSEWSSFDKVKGCRQGKPCHSISVKCASLRDVINEFGMPFYIKIDIEGNDHLCIRALQGIPLGLLPQYISVEAQRLGWLYLFQELGYSDFQIVNQRDNSKIDFPGWKFKGGSSGLFGEDLPQTWSKNIEKVAYEWLHQKLGFAERHSLGIGWYDFHVRKP